MLARSAISVWPAQKEASFFAIRKPLSRHLQQPSTTGKVGKWYKEAEAVVLLSKEIKCKHSLQCLHNHY